MMSSHWYRTAHRGLFYGLVIGAAFLMMAGCESEETAEPTHSPGDSLVVVGTLMDTQCFAQQRDEVGDEAAYAQAGTFSCSGEFVEEGGPAGLVEENTDPSDEATWILVAVPQMLSAHMGDRVRVGGQFRSRGVLVPHRIDLDDDGNWVHIF